VRNDPARTRHFEDLTLPHAAAVYRTALYLAGRQDAEDLTQETYLKAFQAFDHFRGPNPKPWLFSILRHAYFDRRRKALREVPVVQFDFDTGIDDCLELHVPSAEVMALNGQFDDDVQSALLALPDEWRLLLLLVDVEDLTCREAAEVMQIPIGTVLSRLYRARQRLYGRLGDYARRAGYDVERMD
jgi:RNA polymerase sigma-70 factor (ECF subfamily)